MSGNIRTEEELNDPEKALASMTLEGGDEGDINVQEGATAVLEKNDRSIRELFTWYNDNELNLHPDWQRHYVWDIKRASTLIESIFMGIPIPVIYLSQTKEGKYEVIDGVQRLTSVFRYIAGEFKLSGLQSFHDFNNKPFKQLPEDRQRQLRNYTFRTFELSKNTPSDILFLIFERLNTGGLKLNEMEIRNCIYRGSLNEAIKKWASNGDFTDCLNVRNFSRRMEDRSLVLRFLAFHQRNYRTATNGLKDFLNRFFEENRNASDETIKGFERVFNHSMRCAKTVFGVDGFRVRRKGSNFTGEWASKPNASIFQVVATSFADKDVGIITRISDAILEEYLDLLEDNDWISAVTRATGDQSNIRYSFEEWNRRLDGLISSYGGQKRARVFSRELKRELFEQDGTCKECGNEIALLNDAEVDHVDQYWRGGVTIPENARLVHRTCNRKRPRNA